MVRDAQFVGKFTRILAGDNTGELVIHTGTSTITLNALKIALESITVKASAKTRSISIDPARVSINDGAQEIF